MLKILDIGDMNNDISVVMTTYNGEKYICEQIDSILSQTLPAREIVIVDDCSTDATWQILQDYAMRFPIIHVYRNDVNLGAHQNFRKAFSLSTCNLIAPSDQDDIWCEDKLEKMREVILERNVDLVYSQEEVLMETGERKISVQNMPDMKVLMWGNNLKGHTFLFKRKMLEVYDVVPTLSFDYAIAMQACMDGSWAVCDEPLSCWRRHSGVMTSFVSQNSELIIEQISRRKKLWYVFKSIHNKSMPIKKSFSERAKLLCMRRDFKICGEICERVAEQSRVGLICASVLNMKVQWGGVTMKEKIAHAMWAFRQPWIYWYDMHNLKSLE